ncbi:MAG: hypothetical protein LBF09_01455 [Odoribacteraceae bacterium]|jgi:hypothetical protein|nr:hypothetical protein [Odoribacteraceae bacterium]
MAKTTRAIAAHYILLPGHPLLKNGSVAWQQDAPPRLLPSSLPARETHGTEFHAGMIVADFAREEIRDWLPGDSLVERLSRLYATCPRETLALAVVQGADWETLSWTTGTTIKKIT